MIGKKINQLATELAPTTTDLTIIGDPVTGVSKKITLEQLGAIFGGAVSFYTTLGDFPATGVIDIIYCAKDTKKLYLWSGSAYVEVFPSQSLLDTYQLRSEKGVSNGYASLDVNGKVPIGQLPNSIMEYKGTWNAATNTPTLANGTGDTGDVYICNAAGTVNFGAGPITFAVGDYVVYSGTIWQRSSGAVGTVTSVGLSITGDSIGVTGSPITTSGTLALAFAGNSTQYINGAGNLVTFPGVINEAQNLITEVYNKTGATLTKGTIVYINGGQGNLPTVTKALATGDSTSAQTYGIVRNDITNNNNGYVVVAGRISDLDTQAYTEGTQLYLSPTTAGTFTSTKPYAPQHLVYVGIVVRAHPTQGVVEVKIQNGYELDELHNVAAQSPDNNDILQYKTATSLWTKVAGTTTNIAEGTNLYYTDARSRAALSFTAGSGAYNSTTGVITIPTNTNQLTNGAAFITLASLSAGAGISYNNTTGVIASTITQYTDALARAAISLTTTGTSGAATYNSTTGVLNIPQYQTALTNPVTGSGTTNYLPKFTGTSTIGNSAITDDGSTVALLSRALSVSGASTLTGRVQGTEIGVTRNGADTIGDGPWFRWTNAAQDRQMLTQLNASNGLTTWAFNGSAWTSLLTLTQSGNLGLGVTPSAWRSTDKVLQINNGVIYDESGVNFWVGQNYYENSSGAYIYLANSGASTYRQWNGNHIWLQAPSGTAGNAISFTQAMTLNASGNLSIGNTNDTYKLDVSGTGRFNASQVDILLNASSTSQYSRLVYLENGAEKGGVQYINSAFSTTARRNKLEIFNSGGIAFITQGAFASPDLLIASTGAATFSSSVTATQLIATNQSTPNLYLSSNAGGTAVNFRITSNESSQQVNQVVESNHPLTFWTNSTERLRITSGGNVGIGTTSPANPESFIRVLNISGGDSALVLSNTNGTTKNWSLGAYDNGAFNITDGNTSRLRITSGGAVEIAQTIQTGAPANGTAQPWKLGNAVSGTVSPSHYLVVEINGQSYTINAFNGFP